MQQRFRNCFKHVLERTDARKDHGDIEDDRKEAAKRNVLQYGRKRYEKETRARADVQPVGKARGNNNERRDHGGDRIKERRVLRHADDVFVLGEIRAVNDHAAARDGQGEKRLPHCPNPDHGITENLPARGEHEAVSLRRARQKRHAHRKDCEDEKEHRHHDPVCLFDAVRAEEERQKRSGNNDNMVRDHGEGPRRKVRKPRRGIRGHKRSDDRIHKRLENVGHNDGVPDGNTERACKRQPAKHRARLPCVFAAGSPGVFVSAERAGGGAAAHRKLRRKADIAEDQHEQNIDKQKRASAVAAHFVRKPPDVRHADGRADRGKDKSPAGRKALYTLFLHRSLLTGKPVCFPMLQSFFILKHCCKKVKKIQNNTPAGRAVENRRKNPLYFSSRACYNSKADKCASSSAG